MKKPIPKVKRTIATIKLEDRGQDFLTLDLLEDGTLIGYGPMFEKGRLSLLGIGTNNGTKYYSLRKIKEMARFPFKNLLIYLKDTKTKLDPLPWNAQVLNYRVKSMK